MILLPSAETTLKHGDHYSTLDLSYNLKPHANQTESPLFLQMSYNLQTILSKDQRTHCTNVIIATERSTESTLHSMPHSYHLTKKMIFTERTS